MAHQMTRYFHNAMALLRSSLREGVIAHSPAKIDKMMFYRNLGNKTNRNGVRNINKNANKVIDYGKLRNIPLVILTSKNDSKWNETKKV